MKFIAIHTANFLKLYLKYLIENFHTDEDFMNTIRGIITLINKALQYCFGEIRGIKISLQSITF